MRNENGIESGHRNIGRLFVWSIPLSLGMAATVWFGLWVAGHEFQQKKSAVARELTQQERSAVYVGAQVRPKGKIAVQLSQDGCFRMVRADLDTKKLDYPHGMSVFSLVLYAQDLCSRERHEYGIGGDTGYRKWSWQSVSPNGTVLESGYENQCPSPSFGEIAECKIEIKLDERIDHFKVWGSNHP